MLLGFTRYSDFNFNLSKLDYVLFITINLIFLFLIFQYLAISNELEKEKEKIANKEKRISSLYPKKKINGK